MFKSTHPLFLSVTLLLFTLVSAARADDFDRLIQQYQQYTLGASTSGRRAVRTGADVLAKSLRPDGSWADVNYASQQRGGWPTYMHLSRVSVMARSYATPNQKFYHNAELAKAFHKAYGYWLRNDFQNPNWWYNVIGVPQVVAAIDILMIGELTPEEIEISVNKILPRSKIGMTGQNRVWVASNTLLRGLLLKDRKMVQEATDVIAEEIRVTTNEGIEPDFSFHQHGPQQQFGNYGLAFAHSMAMWMEVFHGTPFAFSAEKQQILRDYVLEGENWVVWKGMMDLSSCGRQLEEGAFASKGRGVADVMRIMARTDPAEAARYQAFLTRNAAGGANDLVGNRLFWRSDYMIERRPDFYASVKMCSRRTIGCELVNSENVSGYHLADGALYLLRGGEEYDNIQPLWDWQKIPGTTCAQLAGGPPKKFGKRNDSDFVGGVSDGGLGCAAMDYQRDKLSARKAWFFLNDAVACLGAGIGKSDQADPVVTTINQCFLKGDVIASDGGAVKTLGRGEHALGAANWVWHDGMGYLFPQAARVGVAAHEQSGTWRKVEEKESVSKEVVKGDVFLMTLDHGARPSGAGYAYMMFPGVKAAQMAARAQAPGIEILSNTASLQAVRDAKTKMVMAAFYEAGAVEIAPGKGAQVDRPCLLMIGEANGRLQVTVADPTQKLAALNVTLNGKTQSVALPQGGKAGSSVAVIWE